MQVSGISSSRGGMAGVFVGADDGEEGVKKGTHTVGVQRQYTGTAGRIENSRVAVYLVYAGRRGHAAVDRALYIPRSWTCDPDRCRAAGLDEDAVFATVPGLVDDQDRIWVVQMLHHVLPYVIAYRIGIPLGPAQQVLHAIRSRLPGPLGDCPAVLPRQVRLRPIRPSNASCHRAGSTL